jgi:hypothetical protein
MAAGRKPLVKADGWDGIGSGFLNQMKMAAAKNTIALKPVVHDAGIWINALPSNTAINILQAKATATETNTSLGRNRTTSDAIV